MFARLQLSKCISKHCGSPDVTRVTHHWADTTVKLKTTESLCHKIWKTFHLSIHIDQGSNKVLSNPKSMQASSWLFTQKNSCNNCRKAHFLYNYSNSNGDSRMFSYQHLFCKLSDFQVLVFNGASFMWTLSKHPIFMYTKGNVAHSFLAACTERNPCHHVVHSAGFTRFSGPKFKLVQWNEQGLRCKHPVPLLHHHPPKLS